MKKERLLSTSSWKNIKISEHNRALKWERDSVLTPPLKHPPLVDDNHAIWTGALTCLLLAHQNQTKVFQSKEKQLVAPDNWCEAKIVPTFRPISLPSYRTEPHTPSWRRKHTLSVGESWHSNLGSLWGKRPNIAGRGYIQPPLTQLGIQSPAIKSLTACAVNSVESNRIK